MLAGRVLGVRWAGPGADAKNCKKLQKTGDGIGDRGVECVDSEGCRWIGSRRKKGGGSAG